MKTLIISLTILFCFTKNSTAQIIDTFDIESRCSITTFALSCWFLEHCTSYDEEVEVAKLFKRLEKIKISSKNLNLFTELSIKAWEIGNTELAKTISTTITYSNFSKSVAPLFYNHPWYDIPCNTLSVYKNINYRILAMYYNERNNLDSFTNYVNLMNKTLIGIKSKTGANGHYLKGCAYLNLEYFFSRKDYQSIIDKIDFDNTETHYLDLLIKAIKSKYTKIEIKQFVENSIKDIKFIQTFDSTYLIRGIYNPDTTIFKDLKAYTYFLNKRVNIDISSCGFEPRNNEVITTTHLILCFLKTPFISELMKL